MLVIAMESGIFLLKLSFNFTTSKQWKQGLKSSQSEQIATLLL